jgi:hypothetical protein
MNLLSGEYVGADALGDRRQQPRRLADIIGEGRAGQINALAPVNLALPVQRQMIEILRHQHMRQ